MIAFKKVLFLVSTLVLAISANSGVPSLPIRGNSVIGTCPSGIGSSVRLVYLCIALDESDSETEYFRVISSLRPTNSTVLLRGNSERVRFDPGEAIGSERQTFLTGGGASIVELNVFDQSRLKMDVLVRYLDVFADSSPNSFYFQARALTNLLVGYRFLDEEGVHYGWAQFARNDTGFTNIFDLVAHDWNPIPGAAIRAGAPPEIPLVTEVVDDGAGGEVLRTSWNPGVASWIFVTVRRNRWWADVVWGWVWRFAATDGVWQPPPDFGL